MDGSRLSSNVVSDCCAEEPMGLDEVSQSFDHLALKDGDYEIPKSALQACGNVSIDPVLARRIASKVGSSTDSLLTQSAITRSIDSCYGDSITSSIGSLPLRSLGSVDTSLTHSVPSSAATHALQPVPESKTELDPGFVSDEGIEEDEVQSLEAVPTTTSDRATQDVPSTPSLERNEDGDTVLHLNIIYMLVSEVFNVIANLPNRECLDIENHMMQTPLILAALMRQTPAVRRLLIAGADIEKTDRHGDTALHVACRNGDIQMLKQLTKPITANEMRMFPSKYKTCVQRIPQDLNVRNYEGLTPFHMATREGNHDVMMELAHLGADVDAQEGRNGKRAIHMAVEMNREATIRCLVEECAVDIDATTFYNLSPVMLASDKRYNRIVEYLVQCGADHSDLDCSEVEDDSDSSEDIEMFDDFMINGEPIQS